MFSPQLDDSFETWAHLDEITFYFRITFGVAHSTSTLITLPPFRRSLTALFVAVAQNVAVALKCHKKIGATPLFRRRLRWVDIYEIP